MTYMQQIKDDIRNYIDENDIVVTEETREDVYENLCEDLWIDDSVTGNASGSYTFNRSKAREYFFEDGEQYLADMVESFGIDGYELAQRFVNQDWEWIDVSIRCYLLSVAIDEVLLELIEVLN